MSPHIEFEHGTAEILRKNVRRERIGWEAGFSASAFVGSYANRLNSPEPRPEAVPIPEGWVHHPSLMIAGEGCRAVASQSDAEAGLLLSPNELRLGNH